ncbi:hypothetical protein D3C85_1750940 [compost metagenome]
MARAFFYRLPDVAPDEDPTVQAAVDRRIDRMLDDTAARIVAGRMRTRATAAMARGVERDA